MLKLNETIRFLTLASLFSLAACDQGPDEYYSAALKLRDRLTVAETSEAKDDAIAELRNLQDTAFNQLVDEKRSPDDSFQIFITLCNDILRQYSSNSR